MHTTLFFKYILHKIRSSRTFALVKHRTHSRSLDDKKAKQLISRQESISRFVVLLWVSGWLRVLTKSPRRHASRTIRRKDVSASFASRSSWGYIFLRRKIIYCKEHCRFCARKISRWLTRWWSTEVMIYRASEPDNFLQLINTPFHVSILLSLKKIFGMRLFGIYV